MKTSTLLRISAVIMFLYFLGHTSGFPWTPSMEPADLAVIQAMKADHFQVIGVTRTYWNFYVGFGLVISAMQLLEAFVLWQLGSLARTNPARLRPIIGAFFIASVLNAILGVLYFFAIPVAMALIIAIVLLFAFVRSGKEQ